MAVSFGPMPLLTGAPAGFEGLHRACVHGSWDARAMVVKAKKEKDTNEKDAAKAETPKKNGE